MAYLIQQATDGDILRIEPVTPYPMNHAELEEVATAEKAQRACPEIAAQVEDMAQYDTIFIGYPIWYADMPMIVYSFLEQYDLSGKTIVPFITPGPAASPAPSRPSSVSSPTPQSWKTDTPSPATAWGKLLLA